MSLNKNIGRFCLMKRVYAFIVFSLFLIMPIGTLYADSVKANKPQQAAIASGHFLATQAGFEIFAKGGNAFDAAIAVSSTLSVVEPISSGLGGGGFFLLHDAKTNKDIFIDARETSPRSAKQDKYKTADGKFNSDRATNGPWAAGIPGLPAALVYLASHYGQLPLKTSLQPAIKIARDGFPVYARMQEGYESRREVMERFKGTREVFLANGKPIKTGDVFKQPDLARTLEKLGDDGFDGFYRGGIAQQLVNGVNSEGGEWTLEELANYKIKIREPLKFKYHDWQIVTAPPPSSGGIALAQILQILEPYKLNEISEAERVHLSVEAMRRAYRDRTFYLGDPDFIKIPVKLLTSPDYAAGLRAGINALKATPSDMLSGKPTPMEDDETTHFSILDKNGNMVAATQTVNLLYGSGLIPSGTGVLLNNEMDDFALMPGVPNAFGVMGYEANAPQPGKRMLSSMSPTFMRSKDKTAILGTPGGSRIITMVLLGILGYDNGLNAGEIAAFPRYHHQWWPDTIDMEKGAISPTAIEKLQAMGYQFVVPKKNEDGTTSSHVWGNLQTVLWNHVTNKIDAASDPRHDVGKAIVE